MVGCVLVRPTHSPSDAARIIGIGHHRRFGGLHAERDALASCVRMGEPGAARGATAYVTLEPCNGHGKQPPCVEALIQAGVTRVVYAERDPSTNKGGGEETLRRSGIVVERFRGSAAASRVSAPWRKRHATGSPWVIVKWAQTIDGKLATRTGDSKWISNEVSRRWVHLLRARVDVVLTGVGTVMADDPLLTARGVPIRRVAKRVVLDSRLRTPVRSKLVQSARGENGAGDVWVVTLRGAGGGEEALLAAGVQIRVVEPDRFSGSPTDPRPLGGGVRRIPLRETLAWIGAETAAGGLGAQTVLVEAGPRLVGQLLAENLADEIVGFTGGMVLGDPLAPGIVGSTGPHDEGRLVSTIDEARRDRAWTLGLARRIDSGQAADSMTVWRRSGTNW